MTKTYKGSCHCGDMQFEVTMDLDHVRSCDCSICRRRGALLHRVEEKNIRFLTPRENATLYQWHTHTAEDYFCPRCGILPYRRPRTEVTVETPDGPKTFRGWSVNVRCLEGVDLDAIPVVSLKGSQLP